MNINHKQAHQTKEIPLFQGIVPADLQGMLGCLKANVKEYEKQEIILLAGTSNIQVGIVLDGTIEVINENLKGNVSIVEKLTAGNLFGATYICAGVDTIPVTVKALTDCKVMFIAFQRIIHSCSNACEFHQRLIENMMKLLAKKNLTLMEKFEIISQNSIRQRVITYVALEMDKQKSQRVTIPFNRTKLAEYLCVDRSALARELARMREDGIIALEGNFIQLLES